MKIRIKNQTGYIKEVKVGFSWTTLLFGFFVPLFRGDWKWFAIMLLVCLVVGGTTMIPWIASFVFAFTYNNQYLKAMLEKGWIPADESSANVLDSKGIAY